MLKNFFLALSKQEGLRRWMENSPRARVLSQRFIAGNHLEDGLAVVRQLKARGILTALDPLGENVTTEAEARAAGVNAMATLRGAVSAEAGAVLSIKLTQFGLDFSKELTEENVRPLVEYAGAHGSRVEIDMESTAYTQRTVEMLEMLHAAGPVRGVLQAYLYRTAADVARMNELRIPVRLCKGAYNEPPELAMARKADVDESYKRLATALLEKGTYPAFATHDPAMIDHLLALRPAPGDFEFQMLYGIRRDLQERVLASRSGEHRHAPREAAGSGYELYDGSAVHNAVGTYEPNPFGLFNVHGNVFEWCLDGYDELTPSLMRSDDGIDPWVEWEGTGTRRHRGGSFRLGPAAAGSWDLQYDPPDLRGHALGVRPARAVSS